MVDPRPGRQAPEPFDAVLADAGIKTALTGARMPKMNAITQRWMRTCADRRLQTRPVPRPGSGASHSRNALAIHPGWFDRSPCGTGTSARMAQLHARGELPLHTEFVNESFIGTRFTGRLVAETKVAGLPAVVPEFTGRAWITGTATYLLDPAAPFPEGFVF